jgi:DNA mismatch repair protein MutS
MEPDDFIMDEQTYFDLKVDQTKRNSFSIYDLFKKTKTIGARDRLLEILRKPTNKFKDIKLRSDAISALIATPINLNIYHDQFDLILHYLNFQKAYSNGNNIDSLISHLKNEISESASYYTILIGLKQLLSLFKYSSELITVLRKTDSEYLFILAEKIEAILNVSDLSYVLELSKKGKLLFYEIGKLDFIIRRKTKLPIIDLLHIFYELDILETIANTALEQDFCMVDYIQQDSLQIEVEGLFHPGIKHAVRNDIKFNRDEHCVFLTGSNMAGKSSLLRSFGTAIYLAHLGFPVPAKRMSTTILNGLITTINLGDDPAAGLSHYLNEVIRVRNITEVLAQHKKVVVLLDELFRGTNPEDAYAATEIVMNGFSKIPQSAFMISSHLSKLTHQLEPLNIIFKHLEHTIDSEGLTFTYKLKDGVSKEGIGMYFIHKEDIPQRLAHIIKVGS